VPVVEHQPVWSFADSEHGFVADGNKLYATGNGGQSWPSMDLELTDVTQLNFITAEKGWAVAEGKLFKTANGGSDLGTSYQVVVDVGEFIAKLKLL